LGESALYRLPEELRSELKKPLGKLITSSEISKQRLLEETVGAEFVVAVGDATSETLFYFSLKPDIYVIDGKEQRSVRQPPSLEARNEIKVKNPPGFISEEAFKAILKAASLEKPVRIVVEGEEDLLALVFLATYPSTSVLFYGQPNEGIVAVKVGSCREKAVYILEKMGVPKGLMKPLRAAYPFS
jgi:uncharacterized protein (UPF0218 family)